MSAGGTRNSKHTTDEQLFIDRVSARRLMDFCTHMYTPGFLVSNASRFLDHEWVDLPALKYFLETPALMIRTPPQHGQISVQLTGVFSIPFQSVSRPLSVHTPHFIVSHAPRFLDHRWIDVTLLKEFLRANPAYLPSNPVHVKIEANPPLVPPPTAVSVKLEVIAIPPSRSTHSDPLQSLINSFGTHGTPLADSFWLSSTPNVDNSSQSPFAFPTHPGNEELPSFSFPIAVGLDAWPTLPPPQLDFPSPPPMTNVSSTVTAKARSHREPEVDVPTARKRNAEETIGVRKAAKKSKKVGPNHSADVVNANVNSPVTSIYIDSYTHMLLQSYDFYAPSVCLSTFIAHLAAS
ncbi:hypothetical protein B0H13DRAFT_2683091 [Mycena leptocephala]|nr:hypothetical protein B0H13DRAFT_2683091 [Mycena leptocephala]